MKSNHIKTVEKRKMESYHLILLLILITVSIVNNVLKQMSSKKQSLCTATNNKFE